MSSITISPDFGYCVLAVGAAAFTHLYGGALVSRHSKYRHK
jgi:hypothetical protein